MNLGAGGSRPVGRGLAVAVLLAMLVALLGVPLWALVRAAADGGRPVVESLTRPPVRAAIVHTLATAAAATVLAVLAGTALAVRAHRGVLAHPRLTVAGLVAPLLCPEFVLAFGWQQAYGPAGLSDHLLHLTLPGLIGPVGIVVVLACHAVALAFVMIGSALAVRGVTDLELAGRASGAGPVTVARTLTLPLARAPVLAAGAVVFAMSANSFAVPQLLGAPAGFATLSTTVYSALDLASDRPTFAVVCLLATTMVALTVLVLAPVDVGELARRPVPPAVGGPSALRPGRERGPSGWLGSAGIVGYLGLAVVIPTIAVTGAALTRAPGLLPTPGNWTMGNLGTALAGPSVPALWRSLALAATAAVALVLLGALATVVAPRQRWLDVISVLGFAVPGSALAIGVLIGYGSWASGGPLVVLLAFLAKFWAIALRTIAAGVDRLAPETVRASRACGAGAVGTVGRVVLPLVGPAAITAGAVVFVFALHEVTMSSILYGPGSETFAAVVLNAQQLGDPGPTAALALMLTVPPLVLAAAWYALRPRR
jgi:iron(III) transport system permease protein